MMLNIHHFQNIKLIGIKISPKLKEAMSSTTEENGTNQNHGVWALTSPCSMDLHFQWIVNNLTVWVKLLYTGDY